MITVDVIEKAVERLKDALRLMSEHGHGVHAFDVGKTPEGETYSLVLLLVPEAQANQILANVGGGSGLPVVTVDGGRFRPGA